jgi:CobQ-like glutamine amidotransferase family enzyme
MSEKILNILQLYPHDMNIYGDWGNVLVLQKRAMWHGYKVRLLTYNPGDSFPDNVDIVVGGGGQDSGQSAIQNDLQKIAPILKKLADENVPMLMICGLYQLFGNYFLTNSGEKIPGIGIFDLETRASDERMIGNIVTKSDEFGEIIGYENHSGKTFLAPGTKTFGVVQKGAGNNGQDTSEGARYKNVIGTYLHGSLLPKNPQIADWLIEQASVHKYGGFQPNDLDDVFARAARKVATNRPR